ncbi:hypothetical protein AB0M50_51335, partial [Nonomuraea fuscirosea]
GTARRGSTAAAVARAPRRLRRYSGTWTRLLDGERVTGPGWRTERHGFDSLPLLVRPGAVIATGARDDRPDYDYAGGVTLTAYELADGEVATVTVPAPDGRPAAVFEVSRAGSRLRARRIEGAPAPWNLRHAGTHAAAAPGTDHIEISLSAKE